MDLEKIKKRLRPRFNKGEAKELSIGDSKTTLSSIERFIGLMMSVVQLVLVLKSAES